MTSDVSFPDAGIVDNDRPISAADLHVISAEACERYCQTSSGLDGSNKTALTSLVLWVACMEWHAQPDRPTLFWPVAQKGSASFSYTLICAMASMTAQPENQILNSLAMLCLDTEADGPSGEGSLARDAFFAGMGLSRLGRERAEAREAILGQRLNVLVESKVDAQIRRAETMQKKAQALEQRLRDFAIALIDDNPFISDNAIQRLYRERHALPSNSSNAEAKTLSRLRRAGALPKRRAMIDRHLS